MQLPIKLRDFFKEITFAATRSSGAGGQNVNKVSTRVELRFSVKESNILSKDEKEIIIQKLYRRINQEGVLTLTSQSERSQYKNKIIVFDRFINILTEALKPEKPRIPTKPTKASREKRLGIKFKLSEKKNLRKFNDIE